jgi:flavodoxin I
MSSLNSVGIYYGTSTGNTETVAGYIASAAGAEANEIGGTKDEEFLSHDAVIVGAPTWHTGADEQRSGTDWDDWLYKTLPKLDMTGRKVAIFGVGDQESYMDNFCDAAGELYDLFTAKGAKIYGLTSQEGYNHVESKAVKDGKFCGLMCDEDNQYDLSEERAKNWISQLKAEGFM